MIARLAAVCLVLAASVQSVTAQSLQSTLFDVLGMPQMVEIAREEGLATAENLGTDVFPGRSEGEWQRKVSRIYQLGAMTDLVEANFTQALSPEEATALLQFFTSARGESIVTLELSARRALLDEEIEEASKVAATQMAAEYGQHYQLVEEFIDANDLVDSNVAGALNASLAFYRGLADGGAYPAEMGEQAMLAEVWSQEGEIRENMTEWLYSYLLLAYEPLPTQDLQAYIDLSQTPAGAALNRAMFAAFEPLFSETSYALGRAAAEMMASQEL